MKKIKNLLERICDIVDFYSYPSPFEEAAILTIDGVGEWATTTICKGKGKEIEGDLIYSCSKLREFDA